MAPWGGSSPRGAEVVDPAGARDRWRPVGVGGGTGRSSDVREAAAEKAEAQSPARPQPLPGVPPPGPQGRVESAEGSAAGKGLRSSFRTRGRVTPPRRKVGARGAGGPRLWGHSQVGGILFADVLLQDAGVYVGGLQGAIDVMACRGGADGAGGGVLGLWTQPSYYPQAGPSKTHAPGSSPPG